jgi:IS5 family transposase
VYLQTEASIDPSSLTRWRKRIGEEGVETLLMVSVEAARRGGVVKASSVDRVIVDTTVMPKAVAHPTDSCLLEKSRQHLVKVVEEYGMALRQNYNRIAPRIAPQIGRYAHAKQFKRVRRAVRSLRTRVGRVQCEGARQLGTLPEQVQTHVGDLLARTGRILVQRTKDKNKLYALHAPEVECISKGKAKTPHEFGVEVSIATTLKEGLVVGIRSMPGNPYDGHTLAETLEQVSILAEHQANHGDRGQRLSGRGDRRGAHPAALRSEASHHADLEGDDSSAQRHRAGHRAHEDGWAPGPQPAQGHIGRRAARGDVRRGAHLRLILAKLRLLAARFGLTLRVLLTAFAPPAARTQLTRAGKRNCSGRTN